MAERRGRPPIEPSKRKTRVTIRLDPAVLDFFKATGKGWQTRLAEQIRLIADQGKR
jgi:uncharacterized protein (DUF4415 family)